MKEQLRIRPAAPEDLGAVRDLLSAAELPTEGVDAAFADFVVAESGGAVVGAGGFERWGDYALLRSVVVDPSKRSRGAGRAVVERLLADAERAGVHEIYLLTTTAESYFPRFGFRPVARETVPEPVQASAEFRDLCPATASVMARALASREDGRP